jgi:hypothetical protein
MKYRRAYVAEKFVMVKTFSPKAILPKIFWGLLVCGFIIVLLWQAVTYYQTLKVLQNMAPHRVSSLWIYPTVGRPTGTPVKFPAPHPIINDFLTSLRDARRYWPNHDTVDSPTHSWFLEITAAGKTIQLRCHIPSRKNHVVACELGSFHLSGSLFYGDIQSELLRQWYQVYSEQWLSQTP